MAETLIACSLEEQVNQLKELGVTFVFCSEEEASKYLRDKTYLAKILTFCPLFDRHIGGPLDGEYVGLDFAWLKQLASLDQQLRYVLLPMTLDIEHFARVRLVREAMERGENNAGLVREYLASLSTRERSRREADLKRYAKNVSAALPLEELSLDEFLEASTFGSAIDLYLYCAKRWGSKKMQEEHYLLRQVKSVRNACAHSSELLAGIVGRTSEVRISASVGQAVAQTGIPKRTRRAKLRNAQLYAIATVLYMYTRFVEGDSSRRRVVSSIAALTEQMEQAARQVSKNDALCSSLSFLVSLFDNWFCGGDNQRG